jgi:predicted O-methyltransferase YrrM
MANAWWKPSRPDEIKPVPWLHPAAVAYLESILTPDMEVIEHGSGGSTLWFAERVKCVTSFESDPDWRRSVEKQAPQNVDFLEWLSVVFGVLYDLVLVDGEPVENRATWIKTVKRLVKPSGWVVLDNANRPEYAAEREGLREHAELVNTVDGNTGGTKYLVTEFWKMKG